MPTVLLIDDDDLVRQSLAIGLTGAGFATHTASSGSEGLRLLSENSVDVVVTDMFMPDGEGIELITHLRKEGSKIPIIAITGGFSDARALVLDGDATGLVLKSAALLGATRVLTKPFTPAKLAGVVNECLQEVLPERSQQDNGTRIASTSDVAKIEPRKP